LTPQLANLSNLQHQMHSCSLLSTHPRVRFFERQLSRSLVQLSTIANQEDEEVSSAAAVNQCSEMKNRVLRHPLLQNSGRAKSVGEIGSSSSFPSKWHQKMMQRGILRQRIKYVGGDATFKVGKRKRDGSRNYERQSKKSTVLPC
jgi:hypothetical protein